MPGGVFSGAKLHGIKIRESANDGSDFSNPETDYRLAFLGEDGLWHVKDSAGAVTNPYTGGSGTSLNPGTSFPGSPATNELCFRTDRGLLYYYDGTRWLTVTEYEAHAYLVGSAGATSDVNIYFMPIRADGDTYLTKFFISSRVILAATWVVHLMQITTAGAQNDIATLSTAGDSANTETRHETDINALVPNTTFHLDVFLDEQTGSTSCTVSVTLRYRRVG